MKTALCVLLPFVALTLGGCGGSNTSSICSRAVECEYIEPADQAECESDLNKAVSDGKVTNEQIAKCDECARANKCGLDQALDCADACPSELSTLIFGSNFN